jgi:CheY-like chemotaxis protein
MVGTVLIADNDAGVRSLLAEILSLSGARITTAADGQEAVDLLAQQPFDVLVCDLDMPRIAGPEVLARAAALPMPPAAVVVSGFLDGPTREQLQAIPCVRHLLRKPFDILQFLDLVRGMLRAARAAESSTSAAVAAVGGDPSQGAAAAAGMRVPLGEVPLARTQAAPGMMEAGQA